MGSPGNCGRRRWVPFQHVQQWHPPGAAGCGRPTVRASETRPKGAPMPAVHQHSPHHSLTARLRAAGCVFAEDEARLLIDAAPTPAALEGMARRRVAGLPLEHILGWAEFCGLRIAVDSGVFVPRRRTEFLVRQAAGLLDAWRQTPAAAGGPAPVVLDLCCGSGAVGAALAALAGPAELHCADIDAAAVACARRNVLPLRRRGPRRRPLRSAPGGAPGRRPSPGGQCPLRSFGGHRNHAAGGARPRAAGFASTGELTGWTCSAGSPPGRRQWLAPGGHVLIETSRRQAAAGRDLPAIRAGGPGVGL